MAGKRHAAIVAVTQLRKRKEDLLKLKGGIEITQEGDFGDMEVGAQKEIAFKITTSRLRSRDLVGCGIVEHSKKTEFLLRDALNVSAGLQTATISRGHPYVVKCTCQSRAIGFINAMIVFRFHGFSIGREVQVHGVRGDSFKTLLPSTPYVRKRCKPGSDATNIVRAPAAIKNASKKKKPKPLGLYPLPPEFSNSDTMTALVNSTYSKDLSANYQQMFQQLLWAEEFQAKKDIRLYDIQRADFVANPGAAHNQWLSVPGLAEKRPSVLRGDSVFAMPLNSDTEYEGKVQRVEQERVLLCFHKSFAVQHVNHKKYTIRFTFSRRPFRLMHQAVELAEKSQLKAILFPEPSRSTALQAVDNTDLAWSRSLNPEQEQAVKHVLNLHAGREAAAPYIIFGPPGTGKTVTLLECLIQLIKTQPFSKLLVCAPSNTAADLVCQGLVNKLEIKEMIRINAYAREVRDVPENIRPHCFLSESEGTWEFPPLHAILAARVVVTTCVSAGGLYQNQVPSSHFTGIFIDEAAQAQEPEILISISGLMSATTVVVLAGDHMQLGPVIRSSLAAQCGLGTSLLERLALRPVYQPTDGVRDCQRITKLLCNYRSHPAILENANNLFYGGELVARAKACSFVGWHELPNPKIPVIFHGVVGKEMREGNSPSWFNPDEAVILQSYIEKIIAFKKSGTKPEDIGCISPYCKQVQKIRLLLKNHNLGGATVGSVEQFQGQERQVIIISIVRSKPQFLDFDARHNLGFLNNPKRFNVATTRAKALMIVIGNPLLAANDEHWGEFLKWCVQNKAYTGMPLPPGQGDPAAAVDEMDNLMEEFDRLGLTDSGAFEFEDPDDVLESANTTTQHGISQRQLQEDPEWPGAL